MKKRLKAEIPYILALFVFLFVIPHILMVQTGFQGMFHSPLDDPYSLGVWICVPFCGSVIALVHVVQGGRFSLLLVLEAALAMVTYLVHLKGTDVLFLSVSVIFVLMLEGFAFMARFEKPAQDGKKQSWLAGAAANRKYLAIVFFLAVPVTAVVRVVAGTGSQYTIMGITVLMIPYLIAMAKLPALEKERLTPGGFVGVLLIMLVSILAATDFFRNPGWSAYLIFVLLGFGLLLFWERWRQV